MPVINVLCSGEVIGWFTITAALLNLVGHRLESSPKIMSSSKKISIIVRVLSTIILCLLFIINKR